jgi:acetyl esterase/lipase
MKLFKSRIVRVLLIFCIIVLLIFFFLKGCYYHYDETDVAKPPRGFPSYTFIKFAYLLKFIKLVDLQPEVPSSLVEIKNLEYKKAGEKSLQLDIYHLKKMSQPAPVLIFVHGGGWRTGKRSDYLPYLIDFAEKGYVTATISYRLQKKAKFPAAIQDVKCAIKWIRAHAQDYFIDPNKIAIIGGSAGGHLSLMVAYASEKNYFDGECEYDSVSSRIQAVVDLYGPVDLTTKYAAARYETKDFLGNEYGHAPELYEKASPINYISKDDPPTLIFQGTIDELVPVSQSDSLIVRLENVGVKHEYHRLKGWPHTMDAVTSVNIYCQHYMDAFFEKYIPFSNEK